MATATLSATGKKWALGHMLSGSAESLVLQLLHKRNLDTDKDLTTLEERFPHMQKAVQRIENAIANKEVIAIFGDYDCDGITSAMQLIRYFKRKGVQAILRLPHREKDGYGFNENIITEFAAQNVSLIITVDTGVSAIEEIASAKQKSMDVIVTDHHTLPTDLPNAFAILHPDLSSIYPTPHPSGSGVAYQLVFALEKGRWEDMETDIIFAMLGTVADLVELKGGNRQLVQQGLKALSSTTYQPLLQMLVISNIQKEHVYSTDIAFRIAPRINASGRIGDPTKAVDALLHGGKAMEELDALNKGRQAQTRQHMEQALENIDTENLSPLLSTLDTTYAHGIIGLIAGRLTEQFGKPSIVATAQGNICTASLRSPSCYHITEGLHRCQDLLERFGGHAQAAGCTLHRSNWPELCKRLTEDIQHNTTVDDLQPTLIIDAELKLNDIHLKLIESLNQLEPYGQGNKEPLFLLKNIKIEEVRCVGDDASHLQCKIGGHKAVGFGLGEYAYMSDDLLDIAFRIGLDTWQGACAPQIMIIDIKRSR